MASVTVYTAARSKAIEDASIVDGRIDGNDLILQRFDATEINAGNVRGPQGIPGTPVPAGTFIMGNWASDPVGYLILDGSLVIGGAVTYPLLASAFPSWVSGSNLQLPNASGAVPMGGPTPGVVSGSMTHTLSVAQLAGHSHVGASHSHTITHGHTASAGLQSADHAHYTSGATATDGAHEHRMNASGSRFQWTVQDTHVAGNAVSAAPGPYTAQNFDVVASYSSAHAHSFAAWSGGVNQNHTHSIGVDAHTGSSGTAGVVATSSVGGDSPVDHTPKNITVKYAVKT